MSNEISFIPATVNPEGKTTSERRLDVVRNASNAATMALCGASGAVGKVARGAASHSGLQQIAKACAEANYRPLAEYISAHTGNPTVISSRAAFEGMPDVLEAAILKAKNGKNGGYRQKKDGTFVATSTLSTTMRLKAEVVEIVEAVRAVYADRAASKQAALTN